MRSSSIGNVRDVEKRDAPSIARLIRSSYDPLPPEQIPADMPLYHPEHHLAQIADPGTHWGILAVQGEIVGVVMWRYHNQLAHLHLLFVAGPHQRQGFGMHLLRYFEETAIRERPDTRLLTLHCMVEAQRAMRFYVHHGYTRYEKGAEGNHPDLYLWLDEARQLDSPWPKKSDKALLYKLVKG